jgi:radical SAM superfamily enzyme YgiQ (UPF0313 family)
MTEVVLCQVPYKEIYGEVKGVSYLDPPLNLCYLAAILEKNGIEVEIIDSEAEELDKDETVKRILSITPKIVGFSCTTPMISSVKYCAEKIKEENKDIKIVLGGPHITVVWKDVIKLHYVDFCIRGEGEYPLLELVQAILKKSDTKHIANIADKENNNALRPLIENLDDLPIPARHLLKSIQKYKHATISKKTGYFQTIISSRGCPMMCIFCSANVTFGRKVRYRDPIKVVDEIQECVDKYKSQSIGFLDDTLTLNKQHITKICDEIIKRGLNEKIEWFCQARVDTVTKEMLDLMKKAGCYSIHYGIESGSQRILNILKKGFTLEQVERAIKLTKEAGIHVHGYFVLGSPTETKDEIEKTIKWSKYLNPDTAQFTLLTPFPGTESYETYLTEHPNSKPFEEFKWYENVFFDSKELPKEEILRLRKKAYKEFYLRPSYIIKRLLDVNSIDSIKKSIINFKTLLGVVK